jgi:AcrR family transcriptional regulator
MAERTTRAPGSRQRARATPYERARDVGRDALRDAVLQAAGELLSLEGAGALTMRRIADHIGSSTTPLYAVFDGKHGIIDAMVREGHELLRARLEAIPTTDDPLTRLAATGRVYREQALADPSRYQLMFGNAVPGYQRSEITVKAARASRDALASVVRECIDAGVLDKSSDPGFVSEILIAAAHGAVSLELSGHFEDPSLADERFSVLSAASLAPFLAR